MKRKIAFHSAVAAYFLTLRDRLSFHSTEKRCRQGTNLGDGDVMSAKQNGFSGFQVFEIARKVRLRFMDVKFNHEAKISLKIELIQTYYRPSR
jgi:hypothetical protein